MQQTSVERSRGLAILTTGIAIGVILATLAAGSITGAGGATRSPVNTRGPNPVIKRLQFKVVQGSGQGGNNSGLRSIALCPRGWNVLNGGFETTPGVTVQVNAPGNPAFSGRREGWRVVGRVGDQGGSLDAVAVCVRT